MIDEDAFMEQYNKNRKYCPICGSDQFWISYCGCIFNPEKPEEYEDLSICDCLGCRNRHTFHERVGTKPMTNEEFIEIIKNIVIELESYDSIEQTINAIASFRLPMLRLVYIDHKYKDSEGKLLAKDICGRKEELITFVKDHPDFSFLKVY